MPVPFFTWLKCAIYKHDPPIAKIIILVMPSYLTAQHSVIEISDARRYRTCIGKAINS